MSGKPKVKVYEAAATGIRIDDDGRTVRLQFTGSPSDEPLSIVLGRSTFDRFMFSADKAAKDRPKIVFGSMPNR